LSIDFRKWKIKKFFQAIAWVKFLTASFATIHDRLDPSYSQKRFEMVESMNCRGKAKRGKLLLEPWVTEGNALLAETDLHSSSHEWPAFGDCKKANRYRPKNFPKAVHTFDTIPHAHRSYNFKFDAHRAGSSSQNPGREDSIDRESGTGQS
jgi:hypothetical protein